MSTKLDQFVQIANFVKEFEEFEELARKSFLIIKKMRATLLKLKNYNNLGRSETYKHGILKTGTSKMIPDMKIIIVNGIPKIYSRWNK